jgi:hypothetical protein
MIRFHSLTPRIATALSLSFGLCFPAAASPWGAPSGDLLVITRTDYFRADLTASDTVAAGRFQRVEANTYAEFGVTDNVTIGGKLVYGTSWLQRGVDVQDDSGVTDFGGFAQYRFHSGRYDVASARASVVAPSSIGAGLRQGLAGDGVDVEITGLYGRTLRRKEPKIFATIEAGYVKRVSGASDQIRTQTTWGLEPGERWMLLLDGFATLSVSNEQPGGADFDVLKLQPSIVFRASRRWAFQAGVTEEVAARNLDRGRTIFIGLWTRL